MVNWYRYMTEIMVQDFGGRSGSWNHQINVAIVLVGVACDKPGDELRTPSKWGGFLPDIPFDALAYGIPFISGKDSLHNQFTAWGKYISKMA